MSAGEDRGLRRRIRRRPPGVAHSFRTGGDHPATWLTIHAPHGGFAAFMRGIRDGVRVEWDIAPVPADGGLPASEEIVSTNAVDGMSGGTAASAVERGSRVP